MGTLNISQLSLPYSHDQEAGRYPIFRSGALPGLGPHCATKYTAEGLIVLRREYALRGGRLWHEGHISCQRSHTKRRDAGRSRKSAFRGKAEAQPETGSELFQHLSIKPHSAAYASTTSPAGHFNRMIQWIGHNHPTSAIRCSELALQQDHCSFPPLRLLLGSYLAESVKDRLTSKHP